MSRTITLRLSTPAHYLLTCLYARDAQNRIESMYVRTRLISARNIRVSLCLSLTFSPLTHTLCHPPLASPRLAERLQHTRSPFVYDASASLDIRDKYLMNRALCSCCEATQCSAALVL